MLLPNWAEDNTSMYQILSSEKKKKKIVGETSIEQLKKRRSAVFAQTRGFIFSAGPANTDLASCTSAGGRWLKKDKEKKKKIECNVKFFFFLANARHGRTQLFALGSSSSYLACTFSAIGQ